MAMGVHRATMPRPNKQPCYHKTISQSIARASLFVEFRSGLWQIMIDYITRSTKIQMVNAPCGQLSSVVMFAFLNGTRGHPFNNFFGSQAAVVDGAVYVCTSDFLGGNRVDAFRLP